VIQIDKKQILIPLVNVLTGLVTVIEQENKKTLTHDGGEGSGNHGHKGRPGKIGGSGEGGGSSETGPKTKAEYVEALLGHEKAGYPESKRAILGERSLSHLENSYKEMIVKYGPSKKEVKSESEKGSKFPSTVKKLWDYKTIAGLRSLASEYVKGDPKQYSRPGLAIHIALKARANGETDHLYKGLKEAYPEAPKSYEEVEKMHPLALSYRCKLAAIEGWDKLTERHLKAKLAKAYGYYKPDSATVKSVKSVAEKTKEQPVPENNRQIVRGQDSFMKRYVPPAKTVNEYEEAVEGSLEFHANKNKMSVEEYKKAVSEKIQSMIDNCDLKMRIRPSVLHDFILHNGGRMKNQFETGTSGGCLSSSARSRCEKSYWDIHHEADGASRPIYGYMYSDEAFDSRGPGYVDHYGGLSITFKSEVKQRATVTCGDTLNKHRGEYNTSFLAKPVTNVDYSILSRDVLSSLSGDPLKAGNLSEIRGEYFEAQIFGPTTVHDIAHVSFAGTEPEKRITDVLDKLGIPWHKGKEKE